MSSAATRPHSGAPRATVVVSGDDVYEDLFAASAQLQAILTEAGFAARTALGTAAADAAGRGSLVVLDTAAGSFDPATQRRLVSAVRAGTGLIAIHSAIVPGLPAGAELLDAIGARYLDHGPRPHESRFEVELDAEHEITRGLASFPVTHEHYRVALSPDARPIAWRAGDGIREPVSHVKKEGEGRVCYLQLGHDQGIWGEPPVRALIARAARWAVSA